MQALTAAASAFLRSTLRLPLVHAQCMGSKRAIRTDQLDFTCLQSGAEDSAGPCYCPRRPKVVSFTRYTRTVPPPR
jgi:hypothetical protein